MTHTWFCPIATHSFRDVSSIVAGLKKQALKMGDELSEQNEIIERIHAKAQVNVDSAYKTTDRINKK